MSTKERGMNHGTSFPCAARDWSACCGPVRRRAPSLLLIAFLGCVALIPALSGDASALDSGRSAAAAPDSVARTEYRLTLPEAIARAREVSPRLQALEARVRAGTEAARGARAARFPELDLTAGYTRFSGVPPFTVTFPGGLSETLFPDIRNGYRSRLGLSLPLFTGGRISGSIAAAEAEADSRGEDFRTGAADLVLETTTAWWTLVTTTAGAAVVDSGLTAYDQHLKDARNRNSAGLAARNEVLAVEVERDRAEVRLLQARRDEESAQANLRRLLDLDPRTRIVPLSASEQEGSVPGNPREQEGSVPGNPREAPLDTLVQAAYRNRPERRALASRVEAARARARAERGAFWPQVLVSAGYDEARPNRRYTPPVDEWKDSWDASVGVSMTLFDGGRNSAAAARASAEAAAAELELRDLDARIRLDLTTRLLDVNTAEAALRVAERALASARENRRVARDRYLEGVGFSSDLLDAEVALLRAGLERTEAVARLHLARAALERATGRV